MIRRIVRRAPLRWLVTFGVVLAVTASLSPVSGAKSKPPIYFGAVLALTGAFSSFEKPNLQGLEAGIAVVNEHGGILGRKVKLVYENDASTPSKVTLAAQQLLQQYKLAYLEAEVIPTFQDSILPYTKQEKIITIEPTVGPGLFTVTKNPYNFQDYPTTGPAQATVAAVKKLEGSTPIKLALVNTGDSAQSEIAQHVATGVKKLGGTVVYTSTVSPTASDDTVQLAAAQQAGANVLIAQVGGTSCNTVTSGIKTLAWSTVKVILSPGCISAPVMSAVPSTETSRVFAIGQNSYLQSPTGGAASQFKQFVPALEKYGTITDLGVSANLGVIANIMQYAIDKAGTTNTTKVLKVLNDLDKTKLPASLLYDLPNPAWSSTVHSYDNASLSSYWALMHPGTPKDGAYTGELLAVPSTTPT